MNGWDYIFFPESYVLALVMVGVLFTGAWTGLRQGLATAKRYCRFHDNDPDRPCRECFPGDWP